MVPVFMGEAAGREALGFVKGRVPHISARFQRLPLHDPKVVKDWVFKGTVFGRHDGGFFELMGGTFSPGGREVSSWAQPLIAEKGGPGLVVLFAHQQDGELFLLLQASSEPGNLGVIVQGNDEELAALVADNRGEIVTAKVEGGETRGLLSSVLVRPTIQGSASNIAKHDLRVPLVSLYNRLFGQGRVHCFAQVEDGGKRFQHVNHYAVVLLTDDERAAVDAELLNPPQIPIKADDPSGAQKPAYSADNFFWVSLGGFEELELNGAANAYATSLAGRLVRFANRSVQPFRPVEILTR